MIRYNAVSRESRAVQEHHWPQLSRSSSSSILSNHFIPPMFLVQLSTNYFRKANRKDIIEAYNKREERAQAGDKDKCSTANKEILTCKGEMPLGQKLALYNRGGLASKNRFMQAKLKEAGRVEAELVESQGMFLQPAKQREVDELDARSSGVEGECMVCLSSLANSVNYPCFHGGICEECNLKVLEKGPPSCVICKQVGRAHQGGRYGHQVRHRQEG